MTSFIPSNGQAAAIRDIKAWFETRTDEQQVFRLFGYAGSGKSTVLKFALEELGLAPHRSARDSSCVPGVVTATFTGKAALVLSRKGTPARTIHSLIYSVTEATEEEVEAAARKVREAEISVRSLSGFDRTAAEAGIEAMRQALSAMKKPRFALNSQSDAAEAKLIVLDPRLSNTASMADHWLPTWPGSEAAVLLAIANYLIQNDLYDKTFVRKWVNWEVYLKAEHPN